MSDANLRDKAPTDVVVRSSASGTPTGPHPIPGGEYDRDGFLYRCHVENTRHERIRTELSSVLRAYMRRNHGPRALVAADVGLYARREDRFAKPLAPDILVSLTAGDLATPGTPPEADRMSYKLWQEPVPDFVLEIISPRSGERDTREKPNRLRGDRHPRVLGFRPAPALAAGRVAWAPPRGREVPGRRTASGGPGTFSRRAGPWHTPGAAPGSHGLLERRPQAVSLRGRPRYRFARPTPRASSHGGGRVGRSRISRGTHGGRRGTCSLRRRTRNLRRSASSSAGSGTRTPTQTLTPRDADFAPVWGTSCYELKTNLAVGGQSVYDSSLP